MKRYISVIQSGIVLGFLLAAASVGAQAPNAGERGPSQAELDQMLAPVALYPDSVLSHLLIAATYPLEVVMAERWTRNNPGLEGQAAVDAVEAEDWDPSVKALVAFPDLLRRMSEDLDWTESLGEAFLADEERVLDSIQNLRQKAYDAGSLNDLEHLAVTREERQIIIEPVVREVVYIPYYNTRVVYGSWWWADYPPLHWHHHHYHHPRHVVYWGPRTHVSWHFFFGAFRWDHRHVVVIDRGHRHHHRLYRARHVAHYQHSRHWQHNPYHRRGVQYRNPRTRDYFLRQHRERGDTSPYTRTVRSNVKQARQPIQRDEVKRRLSATRSIQKQNTRSVQEARQQRQSTAAVKRGSVEKNVPQRIQRAGKSENAARAEIAGRQDANSAKARVLRDNSSRGTTFRDSNVRDTRVQQVTRDISPSNSRSNSRGNTAPVKATSQREKSAASRPATRMRASTPAAGQSRATRQSQLKTRSR